MLYLYLIRVGGQQFVTKAQKLSSPPLPLAVSFTCPSAISQQKRIKLQSTNQSGAQNPMKPNSTYELIADFEGDGFVRGMKG